MGQSKVTCHFLVHPDTSAWEQNGSERTAAEYSTHVNKLLTVRQRGNQMVTSQTLVLLGGCGGLHWRMWCLPDVGRYSVGGLSRRGEWSSGQPVGKQQRGPGIAGWLIMVAETDQGR